MTQQPIQGMQSLSNDRAPLADEPPLQRRVSSVLDEYLTLIETGTTIAFSPSMKISLRNCDRICRCSDPCTTHLAAEGASKSGAIY